MALAGHTEAGKEPKLVIAFSRDAGASFSKPVRIDNGGTMGRVDIAILENETTYVTWLENGDQGAYIIGAHVDKDGEVLSKSTLVETDAARSSGFPVLETTKDGLMLAWTHTLGNESTVKTGIIDFE